MTELDENGFKIRTIRKTMKNGVKYVYRRKMRYNPKKGFEEVVESELIGKILPGEEEIRPTRPKKASKKSADASAAERTIDAERKRTGMMDMLEFVGKTTGIDRAVCNALSSSHAAKLLTIARFWASTHDTLPHLEKWQIMHETPYPEGISENCYYHFFQDLGRDEASRQRLFAALAALAGNSPTLAFDTTTISTYSENQTSARYGFNKEKDGLRTLKLLTLYAQGLHLPIAFAFQPGNIPDCLSVENAVSQLEALSVSKPEIVFDAGFGTRANLGFLLRHHRKYLGLADFGAQWIRRLLDATDPLEGPRTDAKEWEPIIEFSSVSARERLDSLEAACPFDEHITGVTVWGMFPFQWERKRSRNGKEVGAIEYKRFRNYIHFFCNTQRREALIAELRGTLNTLRKQLLSGLELFTPEAKHLIDTYLVVKRVKGRQLNVAFNDAAFKEACRNFGIFALISNEESDCFEALKKYRMREHIEGSYRDEKTNLDGRKPRTWTLESLTGRELCRMIAMGYEFNLQARLDKVREAVQSRAADGSRTKMEREEYRRLLTWLNDRSALGILEWFDCIETIKVDTPMAKKRWSTETTRRDQLFLELFYDHEL